MNIKESKTRTLFCDRCGDTWAVPVNSTGEPDLESCGPEILNCPACGQTASDPGKTPVRAHGDAPAISS